MRLEKYVHGYVRVCLTRGVGEEEPEMRDFDVKLTAILKTPKSASVQTLVHTYKVTLLFRVSVLQ